MNVIKVLILRTFLNREDLIHFSEPLFRRTFGVVFRQPNVADDIFASQFNPYLWMSVATFCAAMVFYMWIFARMKKLKNFGFKESLSWVLCKWNP